MCIDGDSQSLCWNKFDCYVYTSGSHDYDTAL